MEAGTPTTTTSTRTIKARGRRVPWRCNQR